MSHATPARDGRARLLPAAEVVERALAARRTDELVVLVEESSEAELRYANTTATTNGVRRDRRVAVIAVARDGAGARTGGASGSGAFAVEDLVRAAEAELEGAAPAVDAAPLLDGRTDPTFGEPPGETDLGALGPLVEGLQGAFDRARAAGEVLAGFAEHAVETVYLGTSTGMRLRHEQPTGRIQLVARADGGARSAWVGAAVRDFAEIDVDAMDARLARRLAWGSRRVGFPAGRYEVLLPPDAVADLMLPLVQAASGVEADEGRSCFSAPGGGTRIGDRLASLPFALRSDPDAPGLASRPFLATGASSADVSVFDNGAELGATAWIEDGELRRLRRHRAGAAAIGVAATYPVDNLVLELPGATASLDDLVERSTRALLCTCLWYIREVDPTTLLLTGLTRDGVYLVEDGEVVGQAPNFRFNESPLGVLERAAEAGASTRALSREWGEWEPRTAMPPLRVAAFTMSSVSPAT